MCSSFRGRSKTLFARAVKNFRKEVERCHRLWEKGGAPRFYRATTPEEIARVYSVLEEQQSARHAALGSKYVLDEPAYRAFYERLAMDGSEAELAALFAVEAQGEIIATLFGIVHDGAFTLLRISTAGHAWGHLSPGRLVVVEAMKYFVARGVRRFDMGIGDYLQTRVWRRRRAALRFDRRPRPLSFAGRAVSSPERPAAPEQAGARRLPAFQAGFAALNEGREADFRPKGRSDIRRARLSRPSGVSATFLLQPVPHSPSCPKAIQLRVLKHASRKAFAT